MAASFKGTKPRDLLIGLMVILVIIFSLYWFMVRPKRLRQACGEKAIAESINRTLGPDSDEDLDEAARDSLKEAVYDATLNDCLKKAGLED